MYLASLHLQNFRSYQKNDFDFSPKTTIVTGPNSSGKTNLVEAINLLSLGKSFKAEKDMQMIRFEEEFSRIKGLVRVGENGDIKLEVVLATNNLAVKNSSKKFLVNGVAKRRADFIGNLFTVLFSPADLEIVVDSPHLRRNFLDEILEQVDKDYRLALINYEKSLRQRNALLDEARERGIRRAREFEYWDSLLIGSGEVITQKREELITFINASQKDIFDFTAAYDKSIISKARLKQYENEEMAAGVTLVGPHRDDFVILMYNNKAQTVHNIRLFGSRGQQRLAILQLKFLQLDFMEKRIGQRPLFILDDVFSELDSEHIKLVMNLVTAQQTIITTTHKEFLSKNILKEAGVIDLRAREG